MKCGYWKKRQWVLLILILSRNSIYPNIWFSHPLHYHSSWKIKNLFKRNYSQRISYFKNIRQLYKFIVLPQELTYVVKHNSKGKKSYTENEVISMLEFLIYNIFVEFGWQFFFSKSLTFLWGQIMSLSLPIFSATHMSQNLCKSFHDYINLLRE